MPNTTQDSIYYQDSTTQYGEAATSAAMASSVQNAFNNRQRYNYVWANAAARTAQTGMMESSTGYQVDTRSEYIYYSGSWILARSHAEFTASSTIPNATTSLIGALTIDSGNSTDASFVTPGAAGFLSIALPGIYAISYTVQLSVSPVNSGQIAIRDNTPTPIIYGPQLPGQSTSSVAMPNFRTTATPSNVSFTVFQNNGTSATASCRVRITRMG